MFDNQVLPQPTRNPRVKDADRFSNASSSNDAKSEITISNGKKIIDI
jgi:hypothetical protein